MYINTETQFYLEEKVKTMRILTSMSICHPVFNIVTGKNAQ